MVDRTILKLLILTLTLTFFSAIGFADNYQTVAPNLPDYFAQKPPKPPLSKRAAREFYWLRNFYISGFGGIGFIHINDITPNQPIPGLPIVLTTDSIKNTQGHGGVALGYQINSTGFLSRVALVYIFRPSISYNLNPVFSNVPSSDFPTQTLNSSLQTHLLLFNVYYDINLDWPVVPYIQLGAGVAFNTVKLNSAFVTVNGGTDGKFPFFTDKKDSTKTGLAADGGVGLRFLLSKNFIFFVNYQFNYTGTAEWVFNTGPSSSLGVVTLDTGKQFNNSVNAGITILFT